MRLLLTFLVWVMIMTGCTGDGGHTEQVAEARNVIQSFSSALKQELLAGLGEGGPSSALSVCKEMAPFIAAGISEETGWQVARTSLKVRNPDNEPDDWERQVLAQFETRLQQGEAIEKLEYHAVINEEGRRVFRYMKAIPTGKLCLQCHGSELATETVTKLDELYPADQARDFTSGDIRGAFTLRRAL
jgi:hypothetical protein